MEPLLNYLIKSSICLLVLYLFYYVLLRAQTNFKFNRLYLLLAPFVALILPVVKWPQALYTQGVLNDALQSIQLNEIVVTGFKPSAAAVSDPAISFTNVLLSLYAFGVLYLLLKLGRQLWQIRQVKANAAACHLTENNVTVYELRIPYPTFAFGNTIFLNKQEHLSTEDQDKILAHELAHVTLCHTWDILYYEVLTSLLWFNPIVWLLKQELRDVHEYQADAEVIHTYKTQEYSALLSREVLLQIGLPIGSYFQKPQVIKRLQMLQQSGQRSGWLRPLLALPVVACLLFAFSLQQADAQISENGTLAEMNLLVESQPIPSEQTDLTVPVAFEPTATQKVSEPERPQVLNKQAQLKEEVTAPASKEATKEETLLNKPEDKPYTFVEQMPVFEGGDIELRKFLAKNIRYPKEAQEKGIEGVVFVNFTVHSDGQLTDYKLLKGLGGEIDAEALRVIKMMNGKWVPGSQNGTAVPVRFTIPVRFVLN